MSRLAAFFRSFGFDVDACMVLSRRFESADDPVRRARDAAAAWLVSATGPWAGDSPAGFATARLAFVRADIAGRFPKAFLAGEVSTEVREAFAGHRPLPLPALVPSQMVPQDVRMLPVVDDVLRSVLPLAPRRS
jgi:hypothetical protein